MESPNERFNDLPCSVQNQIDVANAVLNEPFQEDRVSHRESMLADKNFGAGLRYALATMFRSEPFSHFTHFTDNKPPLLELAGGLGETNKVLNLDELLIRISTVPGHVAINAGLIHLRPLIAHQSYWPGRQMPNVGYLFRQFFFSHPQTGCNPINIKPLEIHQGALYNPQESLADAILKAQVLPAEKQPHLFVVTARLNPGYCVRQLDVLVVKPPFIAKVVDNPTVGSILALYKQ